jgi:nucleotide-binding universal stress UspA family protein
MPVSYETKIKYGETKETIPQTAQEVQADLIVLGAEGTAGLSALMQESTVAEVIRNASCPVLLIPPKTNFHPIHRIVFATDLEGEPFTDVAFVSKLASLFEARILFLHILTEDLPQSRQQAQGELDRLHKRLPYKNATFYSQTNPDIEAGINQFTRRHKADMLVMGYHPRSFWDRLFRPDYTGDIAAHTSLPMLVIHYKH